MKTKTIFLIILFFLAVGCKEHKKKKILKHANSEYRVQKYESSVGLYDQCLEVDPNNEIALLNKALALIELGKIEEALISLNLLLKVNPENTKGTYQKAMCLYQLSQYDESYILFSRLVDENSLERNEIFYYMGLCQYALGNHVKALNDFNAIEKESTLWFDANSWSGKIYEKMKDWHAAINAYRKNIDRGIISPELYFRIGNCYLQLGQKYYANYYFTSSLQKDPMFTPAYLSRGYTHFNIKMFEEAIHDYSQVLELDSTKSVQAIKGIVASNLMLNKVAKAFEAANELVNLAPGDPFTIAVMNAFNSMLADSLDVVSLYPVLEKEFSVPFSE